VTNGVPGIWLSLRLRDVDAMVAWLEAVGFRELMAHRDDDGTLVHAEYLWPLGGGAMVGADREVSRWPQTPGTQAAYLVTDDVDGVYAAAINAGGTSLYEPSATDYGSRDAGVRDPDGNLWSFGTYAPGAV
jgi:uncharacterized glyoxalase superfamily protein PhnB